MRELRLLSVKFRNVLGIEERGIDPQGRAVVVSGKNATGKSSILRATQAALAGGSLATLRRVDTPEDQEPEVVIEIGGPGGDFLVEKRGGETARVKRRVGDSAAFEDVVQPQRFLSSLFDTRGANPVALLQAKEKDLALLILEALPLDMDETALASILTDLGSYLQPVPAGLHPLEHLRLVRDMLFTARTGVNRDAKGKVQAAEQTKRNAPAVVPDGPGQDAIVLQEKKCSDLAAAIARDEAESDGAEQQALAAAESTRDLEEARLTGAFRTDAAKARKEHDARAAEFRAEAEQKIAADLAQTNAAIEGLREAGEQRIAAAATAQEEAAAKAREERQAARVATDVRRAELATARETLAGLRVQDQDASKARALHEQARQFEEEAEAHKAESERLTKALDALDAFRRSLAEHLPVPGLEIAGQDIRLHDVPWDQVNTADRVRALAAIAAARAEQNPLRVMFLDGLESLDTANRTALLEEMDRLGVQAFGAVVNDGAPEVRYIGAVHAEPELVGAAPGKVVPMTKGKPRQTVLTE